MKNAVKELFTGFYSLVTGMRITLGQFFKPTVTVRYPHESLKMPKRFRGHIELVCDPATGKPKCFVCKLCEKACPSDCISIEGIKPEGAKRKTVTSYRLDFTKCSLCGSCVEACRDGAIRFSRDFNLASTRREDFVMDLFQRLELEAKASPEKPAGGSTEKGAEDSAPVTPVAAPPSNPVVSADGGKALTPPASAAAPAPPAREAAAITETNR